ncbi:MAG: alpha/beta fold hydrolase [Anaerolineales bacterium]|jgi:carboxylesterase
MNTIMPGAEPFLFPGGRIGCLLIHGFTGTPKEMRGLGEHLAEQGHTVLGIRLTAHATKLEDMLRSRWQDWLASAEDGCYLLQGMTEKAVVMGLSMGGVLAMLIGAHHPVSGIVAMSTPYALPPDPRLIFVRPLSKLVRYISKGESDWRDAQSEGTHLDYPAYPLHGIAELRDLMPAMQSRLARITAPVLLIHSKADTSVPPSNVERFAQALTSCKKSIEWVENSGHVITGDIARERVFSLATQFVERVTGASA